MLKKVREMGEVIIVAIVAIILCCLTIYQANEKRKSDVKLEEEAAKAEQERQRAEVYRKSAEESQRQSIHYLQSLDQRNREIQALQNNNLQKSESILSDIQETVKLITGAGIPVISFYDSKNDNYRVILSNESDYPIYDVSLEYVNLSNLIKEQRELVHGELCFPEEDYLKHSIQLNYPGNDLPGRKKQRLNLAIKKSRKNPYWRFKIMTRHATFFQYCLVIDWGNDTEFKYVTFIVKKGRELERIHSNLDEQQIIEFAKKCPLYGEDFAIVH